MSSLSLAFDVLARTDKAERNFDKLGDSMARASRRGSALGSAMGTLAGGAVAKLASAVGGGLASAFRTGFGEVADYQVGLAQANTVIKSTAGAAGVTSTHVEDLASAIQGYSGQTDDSIVSGENLLLTFTNIRNAAGKGNDVFDQTTKIMADMSQALGQDTKTSAIQLGKALNNPIRGVTVLQRVGVSFSDAQKKTIKRLQETGHTADAQKVILAELNKEFGGSAKAFGDTGPGKIAKAKRSFEDFTQGLATATLPLITKLADVATKYVLPALTWLGGAASEVFGILFAGDVTKGPFAEDSGFVDKLFKVRDAMTKVFAYVKANFIPAFLSIVAVVKDKVIPLFVRYYTFIATKVIPAVLRIVGAVIRNLKPAFEALVAFVVQHVVPAVQKLTAKIQPLITALLNIIGPVLKVASKILGFLIPILLKVAGPVFDALISTIGLVITAVTKILTVAVPVFKALGDAAVFMWDKVLRPTLRFLADAFLGVVGTLVNGAAKAFGWVPGIGPKLKAAAKEFNHFRDEVNRSLDGVHKDIHITAHLDGYVNPQDLSVGHRYAVGTRSAASGWALVGERGPELVNMRGGERVYTADDTAGMLGGGATVNMPVQIYGTDNIVHEATRNMAREVTLAVTGF